MRRNRKAEASGFSLWREDLWIPDSTDTGAPGPHITEALPGLWWPDHRRSGFDSSFLRPLYPNCQLRDVLSLLFSLFSDLSVLLVLTLSSLHCGLNTYYRPFAFTFLRNSAGSAFPSLPRETLILNHLCPFVFLGLTPPHLDSDWLELTQM